MNHSNIIRLNTDVVEDRYVEILENTHFSLVATVQRLYFMVRNGEKWALDDPKSNEDGMPVIHNVVKMLGCLRIWQDDAGVWPGDAEEFSKQLSEMSTTQTDLVKESQKSPSYFPDAQFQIGQLSVPSEACF